MRRSWKSTREKALDKWKTKLDTAKVCDDLTRPHSPDDGSGGDGVGAKGDTGDVGSNSDRVTQTRTITKQIAPASKLT